MTQSGRNATILSGASMLILGGIIVVLHLTGPLYANHPRGNPTAGFMGVRWAEQGYLALGAIVAGIGLVVLLAGAMASTEEKKEPAAPAPKTPENPPHQ